MKNWKTKNGYVIYHILRGGCNSYLINYENRNILVDTGSSMYFVRLKKNIDLLDITRKNIDFLILTHTHYDHCQNAAKIKTLENCKIVINENDKESAEKGYTIIPNGTFAVTRLLSDAGKLVGKCMFGYQPFTADILVNERNDTLDGDLNIRLITTEGHSAGSLTVIVDDEIAIVGDEMIGMFKNSIFPPFTDDVSEMIRSWGRLLNTDCEIFLPGHGKEIKRELVQKEYYKYSRKFNVVGIMNKPS
jgi:hydroxyacylglutathione hydrolase